MRGRVFQLIGFIFFISSAIWSQCTPAVIDSLDQPTCTNPTGTIYLSGLPTAGWTVNSIPAGFSQTGTGPIASIAGLTPGTGFSFEYLNPAIPCTALPTSVININSVPTVPATPIAGMVTQPTCIVSTGSVAISNLPTTGGWSLTATGSIPANTFTLTGIGFTFSFANLPVDQYTFTVTLLSTNCTSASSNSVFVNPPLNPSIPIIGVITQPTCSSPTGSVAISGLPVGNWTLNASPGTFSMTGSGTTTLFTGLTAGTTYAFTVTNASSCTSGFSANATILNAPIIPVVPDAVATQPTCPIPTGTITFNAPLGAYNYSLDGITYQSSPVFSGLAGGSYTLYVQNNSSLCTNSNPIGVMVNPTPIPPTVNLLYVDSISCNGLSDGGAAVEIVSGGTPPFVFSWSPVGGINDTVTGLDVGNYNIVVVDAANCIVVQGFIIAEPSPLSITGDSTPVNCNNGNLGTMDVDVFGGTGPYSYVWSPNGQTTDSIGNLPIGAYSVVVSDNNGCQINFGGQITIINSLNVSITPGDTTINPGGSFIANVYNGISYNWSPSEGLNCTNCPNPTITPDSTTTYYVNVMDDNGCTGSDSMIVTVKLLCGEFYVPTIFSPNGTGPDENNKLKVYGKPVCVKDFSFVIYDRWGEKVYEATDITESWDGFYKGKPISMGNFVYNLNIQMYDDTIVHKAGSITLVR